MQKRLIGKNNSYTFDFELPNENDGKQGNFGLVFRGTCDQTKQSVIIRYLADKKLLLNEQHLLLINSIYASLNLLHEGIVQTYDCISDNDGIYIVREQLIGVDLQAVIFTGDYPHLRDTKFLLRVGEKVCEILSVLHQNKIVHRRIQPSTIFLVANETGKIDTENPEVKLLNFEYVQINNQNMLNFSRIPYVLYYSAPELVLQSSSLVNASCDLYSLGITLYEAIIRQHAFECDNNDLNLILNMQISYPLKKHSRIDNVTFSFLQKTTAKHIFKSPPTRYKPEARDKYFFNAQQQRCHSATEMQLTLQLLIEDMPDKTENIFIATLKKIFSKKRKR